TRSSPSSRYTIHESDCTTTATNSTTSFRTSCKGAADDIRAAMRFSNSRSKSSLVQSAGCVMGAGMGIDCRLIGETVEYAFMSYASRLETAETIIRWYIALRVGRGLLGWARLQTFRHSYQIG